MYGILLECVGDQYDRSRCASLTYTHMYAHAYMHTRSESHTHTHTHTHTHIHTGVTISVAFFFLLSYKKPPHWSMQIVLGSLAFIMSIAWLNIEANEVVAVLNSFGLMFGIDVGMNEN